MLFPEVVWEIGPISVWFPGKFTHSFILQLAPSNSITFFYRRPLCLPSSPGSLCIPFLFLAISSLPLGQAITFRACHFWASPTLGPPFGQSLSAEPRLERKRGEGREQQSPFCSWSAAPSGNIHRKWQVEISPYWFYFHSIWKTILTKDVFRTSLRQKIQGSVSGKICFWIHTHNNFKGK